MRNIGIDEAINRIAERTSENRDSIRKSRFQRRTEYTDLYGVPFYAESDEKNEAKFYISVSPDLVYFMRFQFKLHIQESGSSGDGDFEVSMNGVDITNYLIEQADGLWIDGEGLYPTNGGSEDEDYYDILDVATVMYNEDGDSQANARALLKPGFKPMKIKSSGPFKVTMYLYMKYSTNAK